MESLDAALIAALDGIAPPGEKEAWKNVLKYSIIHANPRELNLLERWWGMRHPFTSLLAEKVLNPKYPSPVPWYVEQTKKLLRLDARRRIAVAAVRQLLEDNPDILRGCSEPQQYNRTKTQPHAVWEEWLAVTPERKFRQDMRMTKDDFAALFELVGEHESLQRNHGMCRRKDVEPVAAEMILACAVMRMGGKMPRDIEDCFNLHSQAASKYVHSGMTAIRSNVDAFIDQNPFSTPEKLAALAAGFNARTYKFGEEGVEATMQGCVGAIDGIIVHIKRPDSVNESRAFNRKGYYAVVFICMCDADRNFTYISFPFMGSTADSQAFKLTNVYKWLYEDNVFGDEPYWVAGDAAFTCSNRLLSPYRGPQNAIGTAFNEKLSSLRVNIECAFGLMTARWRILRSAMEFQTELTCAAAFQTCALLHNFLNRRRRAANVRVDTVAAAGVEGSSAIIVHASNETFEVDTGAGRGGLDGARRRERSRAERNVALRDIVAGQHQVATAPADLRAALAQQLRHEYEYNAAAHQRNSRKRLRERAERHVSRTSRAKIMHAAMEL